MINASGDVIEQQLHILIDGLERLKGMEKDDAGVVAAQVILSGALGIGTLSTSTVAGQLISGATEAAAAFAGVQIASVQAVCALAVVIIVSIIIPIIYFMQKPANCICLLINELDDDIELVGDFSVHGKAVLQTSPLSKAVNIENVGTYPVAGLFASSKRDSALVGTQYGFVMKYKDMHLGFGMECPLTGIYHDNNCYCEFTSDAKALAITTSSNNKTSREATKGNIRLSIKCNSGSGSIAYYIARAYKV